MFLISQIKHRLHKNYKKVNLSDFVNLKKTRIFEKKIIMRLFVTLFIVVMSFHCQRALAWNHGVNAGSSASEIASVVPCDSMLLFYADQDQDGWGNEMDTISACFEPAGYVSISGDCDDNNNQTYPGAFEVCNSIDENCDGELDEYVMLQFYKDVDADGFGDLNNMVLACTQPEGFVENTADCDDSAITYEDLDGDGFGSEVTVACGVLASGDCDDTMLLFEDLDNDGFGGQEYAACGMIVSDDCDDSDPTVSPAGNEICNTIDDNCNGEVDEGVLSTFYHDVDLDGFGDVNSVIFACEPTEGYVNNTEDCDDNLLTYSDNDGDSYGGSEWVACGVSNSDDCDDSTILFSDLDGDGFGSLDADACGVAISEDCDDTNAVINPSSLEICNELDDNCNFEVDEFVLNSYYADIDQDGFGNQNDVSFSCNVPLGFVDNYDDCDDNAPMFLDNDSDGQGGTDFVACGIYYGGDCDDSNALVNSSANEICNSIDDNCNTEVDEGVSTTYYADNDGDGFGNLNNAIELCTPIAGYVLDASDCDDNILLYLDADFDGYGGLTLAACGVLLNNDCMDSDGAINPGASELCDNADQNCNGLIDEGLLLPFYLDADADGYGDINVMIEACSATAGYVNDGTDCNDTDAQINPGMVEIADNNIDENCDGQILTEMSEINIAVRVFPNPATDKVTFELSHSDIGQLTIYNLMGQKIMSEKVNGGRFVWDVNEMSNGLYLVEFGSTRVHLTVSH